MLIRVQVVMMKHKFGGRLFSAFELDNHRLATISVNGVL